MTLDRSALVEVLEALKAADVDDRIRQAAQTTYQALMEAELTAVIGAAPFQRSEARTAQRNGHRHRLLTTTAGDLDLRIPKLRTGSFFPSLLERRRRVDQALFAVVMEAYLHGVSTRKVDDLVKALGADTGISKSEVSRICADLDEEVGAFRDRSLRLPCPLQIRRLGVRVSSGAQQVKAVTSETRVMAFVVSHKRALLSHLVGPWCSVGARLFRSGPCWRGADQCFPARLVWIMAWAESEVVHCG
jgi:hypothetical protein